MGRGMCRVSVLPIGSRRNTGTQCRAMSTQTARRSSLWAPPGCVTIVSIMRRLNGAIGRHRRRSRLTRVRGVPLASEAYGFGAC